LVDAHLRVGFAGCIGRIEWSAGGWYGVLHARGITTMVRAFPSAIVR
jgi:hypothetical protein